MKKRNNQKAFTLTELIIIVAVIGILAAVIIPAFLHTTDKTKEKADANFVAAVNSTLDSKKALKTDLSNARKVQNELFSAGYTLDQLSKPERIGDDDEDKYAFVWDSEEEVVMMVKLKTSEVILPEEYRDNTNKGNWYFIGKEMDQNGDGSDALFPSAIAQAKLYFAAKIDDMSEEDKAKSYVFAAKIKMEYEYDGVTYPLADDNANRVQRVYAVYNGENYGTDKNPLGDFTVVQNTKNYRFATNSAADAWIIKYLPLDAAGKTNEYYLQVEGLYENPYINDDTTVQGNEYRIFTKITTAGVSTTGNALEENGW